MTSKDKQVEFSFERFCNFYGELLGGTIDLAREYPQLAAGIVAFITAFVAYKIAVFAMRPKAALVTEPESIEEDKSDEDSEPWRHLPASVLRPAKRGIRGELL